MQVETFEVEVLESGTGKKNCPKDAKAMKEVKALCESLGLDGQNERMGESKKPVENPYREMTELEKNVYKILLPKQTNVENYSAGPIPLRVLQVLTHAKEVAKKTGLFEHFFIWDKEGIQIKDPILVAKKDNYDFMSSGIYFILARWGEELMAFSELADKAFFISKKRICMQLKQCKAKVEADLMLASTEDYESLTDHPTYEGLKT